MKSKKMISMILGLAMLLPMSGCAAKTKTPQIDGYKLLWSDEFDGKKMDEKKQVLIIRIFVVVFIAISAFIAIYQTQSKNESVKFIAQLMGVSWGAMAGAFLAPFLYALYSRKVTAAACWTCFILAPAFTLVGVFCRDAMPTLLKSPINTGALAMLGGLVVVPIVNLFTRKPPKELVDGAFACYEKTTVVQQATALGAETLK